MFYSDVDIRAQKRPRRDNVDDVSEVPQNTASTSISTTPLNGQQPESDHFFRVMSWNIDGKLLS